MNDSINTLSFTPYWYELYKTNARIILQQGGSNSGKSYTTMQLLIFKACTEKNIVITCACSTYPQVYRGVYRDAVDIINKTPYFKKLIPVITRNGFIVPSTGSVLEFCAYPTRESAKSGKRDYLFADELTNWPYEVFFELELRTKKQTFCAWNPNSVFWCHSLYGGKKEPECKWIYSTYKANPFCDPKIAESLEKLKEVDENAYKVYCLGICGSTEGTIITNWSVIDDEDFPTEYKWRALGCDFGFRDPTAIVDVRYSNGCYYIKELKYEGLDNLEIADYLKSLKLGNTKVICDSAEPRAIQELKKLGVITAEPAIKGPDSIKLGIDALKRCHIYVTRSSKNLQTELMRYSYKKDALGNYLNEPAPGYDHLVDSARYVILNQVVNEPGKRRTRLGHW